MKKNSVESGEEEVFVRLKRDLAKAKDEFGEDEDLEDDEDLGEDEDAKVGAEEERTVGDEALVVERVRPRTEPISRLRRNFRHLAKSLYGEELGEQEEWLARNRPRKRGECPQFRPCPFLLCRNHLYLDVHQSTGALKFNFPDVNPTEMPFSCSLDVAGEGRHTLEEVAAFLNMTRERVRQIEASALDRFHRTVDDPSRRLPDGGYLEWEDIEEYEGDEGDGNDDRDDDDIDESEGSGGANVLGDRTVAGENGAALDFSLDDEE